MTELIVLVVAVIAAAFAATIISWLINSHEAIEEERGANELWDRR